MLATFHGPHVLILDEPTNHLDVDSREELIRALAEFPGCVILISHDRHLVDATADRLWLVADGTVKPYDGDMDSYRTRLLAERSLKARENRRSQRDAVLTGDVAGASSAQSRADQRRLDAQRRAEIAPLRKVMQTAERDVERLTADIARLDSRLADPDLYTRDDGAAQKLNMERGQLSKQLEAAEEVWLAATEAYEQAATSAPA